MLCRSITYRGASEKSSIALRATTAGKGAHRASANDGQEHQCEQLLDYRGETVKQGRKGRWAFVLKPSLYQCEHQYTHIKGANDTIGEGLNKQ